MAHLLVLGGHLEAGGAHGDDAAGGGATPRRGGGGLRRKLMSGERSRHLVYRRVCVACYEGGRRDCLRVAGGTKCLDHEREDCSQVRVSVRKEPTPEATDATT